MSDDTTKTILRRVEEIKKLTDRIDDIEKKIDEIRQWKDEMQAVQGMQNAISRIDENLKSIISRFERMDKEQAEHGGMPSSTMG